jgi:four helix bundle protein
MTPEEMKDRTKRFGLRIIRAVASLSRTFAARHIGGQLLRAGTSIGANYRSACRGRTQAEFIAKLGIVEEEADETIYWMEMLVEAGIMPEVKLSALMTEANEILSIVVASINTARGGARNSKRLGRGNPPLDLARDNPQSAIRNPQSAIRNLKNPQSTIRNPQSEESAIRNPQSAMGDDPGTA